MDPVEDFFKTTSDADTSPTQVAGTKKRKRQNPTADHELKRKARFYCTCPQQWKSVSRYNPNRLAEFREEMEFMKNKQLHDSIFGFAQRVIRLWMPSQLVTVTSKVR